MTYELEAGGRKVKVSVRAHPEGGWLVAVDGGPERHVKGARLGAAEWWIEDAEKGRRTVAVHVAGDRFTAQVRGHGVSGAIVDPRDRALATLAGAAEGSVRTPMPGAVVRVLAQKGDPVRKGQVLVVVEAMKMENEFRSPMDGVLADVAVKPGMAVEANALLAVVEAT